MQMKPLGVKLFCLNGHMTTLRVASSCLSLPSGDHLGGIQKYSIPIYQVGYQWVMETKKFLIPALFNADKSADLLAKFGLRPAHKQNLIPQTKKWMSDSGSACLKPKYCLFFDWIHYFAKGCLPLLCIISRFQYPTRNRPYLRAYLPTLPVNWYITTVCTWISFILALECEKKTHRWK